MDKTQRCDQSNKSSEAILFCGIVYYSVQGDSNVWVCCRIPCDNSNKSLEAALCRGAVYYTVEGDSSFRHDLLNGSLTISSMFMWCLFHNNSQKVTWEFGPIPILADFGKQNVEQNRLFTYLHPYSSSFLRIEKLE